MLWWLISIILSIAACAFLLHNTYTKWKNNPVIISFDTEYSSVFDIPFPAVTICPLAKVDVYKLNYAYVYRKLKKDDHYLKDEWSHQNFWDISMICNLRDVNTNNTPEFAGKYIIRDIFMVTMNLLETTGKIYWKNKRITYSDPENSVFKTSITSEGPCFTFNGLSHTDMYRDEVEEELDIMYQSNRNNTGWTIEKGYIDNNIDSFPFRTSQAGISYGLKLKLFITTNQRDDICTDPTKGFKILLHNPTEMPRITEKYVLTSSTSKVTLAVSPHLIKASENIVDLPISIRNCYFSDEKKLRFFKIYTEQNCRIECIVNITREMCNCYPFYFPRENSTRICGFKKLDCIKQVQNLLYKYENMKGQGNIQNTGDEKKFDNFENCDCLQSCSSLDYKADISQAQYLYSITKEFNSGNIDYEPTMTEVSIVNIFFKNTEFLALKRSQIYGPVDFLATIGGILGLYMGFSVLSLMEIIYIILVILLSKPLRRFRRENR